MKKYFAEFLGTAVLVLVACGVAAATGCIFPESGYVATALAFGLTLTAIIYTIGSVSGAHVNPAVSFGVTLSGRMSWKDCGFYVLAQFLGAIVGAALLGVMMGSFASLGANTFGSAGQLAGDMWIAMLAEIILTFIFVAVILNSTSKKEYAAVAGLAIGLTLVAVHLVGIPFTGTSVNPARSFGPALLQGGIALEQVWLFIVAPLIGGALAGMFYRYVLAEETSN